MYLWGSLAMFMDPGGAFELSKTRHPFVLGTAFVMVVLGMVWVGVVFGLVLEYIGWCMTRWRKRHSILSASKHLVILGWTDKTLFLVGELAEMLTTGEDRGGRLVVMGDLDEDSMYEAWRVTYPDFHNRFPHVRVHFWQGKSHEVEDLDRVSISWAKFIIVLGASRDPRVSDSLVLTTLCALQCLPGVASEFALRRAAQAERRLKCAIKVQRFCRGQYWKVASGFGPWLGTYTYLIHL